MKKNVNLNLDIFHTFICVQHRKQRNFTKPMYTKQVLKNLKRYSRFYNVEEAYS